MVVLKRKCNSAMITAELAISLVLVTVVLLVTLGLFNNNLKDMFASGNFKNIFNGESVRTFFAQFNRDYSTSQVDIQLLGQQGLEFVRKKANNSDLNLIDSATAKGKSSEVTISKSNATTIYYLSQVINIIVGSGDICNRLNQESTAVCSELTGTKYALIAKRNSNLLTIIDKESGRLISLKIPNGFTSKDIASNSSSMTDSEKIKAIKALTDEYGSAVSSGYASEVARDINYYSTELNTILANNSEIKGNNIEDAIEALMAQVASSYHDAYAQCNDACEVHGNKTVCWVNRHIKHSGGYDKNNACHGVTWDKNNVAGHPSYDLLVKDINAYLEDLKPYIKDAETVVINSTPDKIQNDKASLPSNTIYTPNTNWYNNTSKQYVAGSEDALEIARPANSKLQKFAKNSTQTTSAFANEYNQQRFAIDGDGGGGGGGGGALTPSANTNTTIKQSQIELLCDSANDVSCNPANSTITAKVVDINSGKSSNAVFSQSYIESPLSTTPKDRIVNAKSLTSRIHVLGDYDSMMSLALTQEYDYKNDGRDAHTMIHVLEADNVNSYTKSSCYVFVTGMKKITSKYGLVSLSKKMQEPGVCVAGRNQY